MNMRAIRSKNTKPELLIRRILHASGFRFRLHAVNLPGKPDIVLPKYRTAIFVHGCFWHAHGCRYFKLPKTRPEFWLEKLTTNQKRDAGNIEAIMQCGWHIIIIWECATKTDDAGLFQLAIRLATCIRESAAKPEPSMTAIP